MRFRPGAGPLFLGLPAVDLRDQQIELALAWPAAEQLSERLACVTDLRSAAALLEEHLEGRLGAVAPPDALVEAAATSWSRGLPVSPGAFAARAGITERQAHRRFVQAVGYGPKFLQRVLRFQAFLAAASSSPAARLGELGAAVGYADQAHLTRETRSLAGRTPRELRANRVRNVQDSHPPPT
ncbi:MAG: AraC family transcriptional regulator [Acidimicrobiia bacterium]|nr:AraC family transcriptional regulator [Acidimicrobiia bacterium]